MNLMSSRLHRSPGPVLNASSPAPGPLPETLQRGSTFQRPPGSRRMAMQCRENCAGHAGSRERRTPGWNPADNSLRKGPPSPTGRRPQARTTPQWPHVPTSAAAAAAGEGQAL